MVPDLRCMKLNEPDDASRKVTDALSFQGTSVSELRPHNSLVAASGTARTYQAPKDPCKVN